MLDYRCVLSHLGMLGLQVCPITPSEKMSFRNGRGQLGLFTFFNIDTFKLEIPDQGAEGGGVSSGTEQEQLTSSHCNLLQKKSSRELLLQKHSVQVTSLGIPTPTCSFIKRSKII